MKILSLFAIFFLNSCSTTNNNISTVDPLPQDFVYLNDTDPRIIESVRYASHENFLGRPVTGYHSKSKIILTKAAAQALSKAQDKLKTYGFGLVAYDGYRPQKAVDDFVSWSKDPCDQKAKKLYYPTINKADVFELGYVAKKSGHSKGSTIDVSLIKLGHTITPVKTSQKPLLNGEMIPFLDDGSVNMGSSFDLFHTASHHDSNLIDPAATKMRNLLRKIMKESGFKEYREEWWHYTLENEPFPNTYFDF